MIIDNKITKIVGGGGYEIAEVRYMDSVVWHKPTIVENPCEKSCQDCQTRCQRSCQNTCEKACQNCQTCQTTCERTAQCGGSQRCNITQQGCGNCMKRQCGSHQGGDS